MARSSALPQDVRDAVDDIVAGAGKGGLTVQVILKRARRWRINIDEVQLQRLLTRSPRYVSGRGDTWKAAPRKPTPAQMKPVPTRYGRTAADFPGLFRKPPPYDFDPG